MTTVRRPQAGNTQGGPYEEGHKTRGQYLQSPVRNVGKGKKNGKKMPKGGY